MVRYKKKQSTLRDKFPSHSYTGDPTLSDKGFELLKGLLCYDPARRMTVPKLSTCVCVCVCVSQAADAEQDGAEQRDKIATPR